MMFPDDSGAVRHQIGPALIEFHKIAISYFSSFAQSDLETSLPTDQ